MLQLLSGHISRNTRNSLGFKKINMFITKLKPALSEKALIPLLVQGSAMKVNKYNSSID